MRSPGMAPGAAAVGPYSHGVAANGFVHLSGQTPLEHYPSGVNRGGFAGALVM